MSCISHICQQTKLEVLYLLWILLTFLFWLLGSRTYSVSESLRFRLPPSVCLSVPRQISITKRDRREISCAQKCASLLSRELQLVITVINCLINYLITPPPVGGRGIEIEPFLSFFIYFFVYFIVSNITRKRLDRFAWNFQGRCGVTMGRPDSIVGKFR